MIRDCRKYELEEVLQYVVPDARKNRLKERRDFDGDMVKVSSDRLYTFQQSHVCYKCGIAGEFFVKEKHSPKDVSFHMNLYAIDVNGEELLMTKDHIIPRSMGGKNHPNNYQTMCVRCNIEKGNGVQRGTYLTKREG